MGRTRDVVCLLLLFIIIGMTQLVYASPDDVYGQNKCHCPPIGGGSTPSTPSDGTPSPTTPVFSSPPPSGSGSIPTPVYSSPPPDGNGSGSIPTPVYSSPPPDGSGSGSIPTPVYSSPPPDGSGSSPSIPTPVPPSQGAAPSTPFLTPPYNAPSFGSPPTYTSPPSPTTPSYGSLPSPSYGSYGTPSVPSSSSPSTPAYTSPPVSSPSIGGSGTTPSTPSDPVPDGSTPSMPDLSPDSSNPGLPGSGTGTCDFWGSHSSALPDILSIFSSISDLFGSGTSFPSMTLEQALKNTRKDGYGSLLREGSASLLNSIVNPTFLFSPQQVRTQFNAALASDRAAAVQGAKFKSANEGRLRP